MIFYVHCVNILWKHQSSSLQYCYNIDTEVFDQNIVIFNFVQIPPALPTNLPPAIFI